MKYFVHYVENSTPKLRAFKTERALQEFIKKFSKKVDPVNGYTIDFAFSGEILSCDEYYRDALRSRK